MRPFLKWAGGKYRLRQHISNVLPAGKRLVEPFAGSCALFLNTQYEKYLLADQNPDLINLYLLLQKEGKDFIDYCRQFFHDKANHKKQFYELRECFNHSEDTRLKSALFIYLNRHGYNGLCRYNSQGKFNVPFGSYDRVYFPEREMIFFHQKSQQATFKCADFLKTMRGSRKQDVIYCDPPYVTLSTTANFTQYSPQSFTLEQHLSLAHCAEKSAEKGVTVVISNHDTTWSRKIYSKATTITSLNVMRHISCVGNNRKITPEIIAVYQRE